ncbi:MAG: hypothetical protein F4210_10850 [Holophagales bacterium]|nr:hypothetical protein [Holophagales bacterium]MYF95986.1 hypothetical protein [Holophagales bacterium]
MTADAGARTELHATIEAAIAEELEVRFGDRFDFGPIRVTERLDLNDDPYLRVEIVFDGGIEEERIKELAKGALGLITAVTKKMRDQQDLSSMRLLPSYIEKSEWEGLAAAV